MVKQKTRISWLLILVGLPFFLEAQQNSSSFWFIENRGQWPGEVLFKADISPEIAVFIENDGITFNLIKPGSTHHSHAHHHDVDTNHHDRTIYGHAYKMRFIGANTNQKPETSQPSPDYINYFTNSSLLNQTSRVRKFEWLQLNDVYPFIDLHVGIRNGNLKLEWKIRKKGNPASINIQYEGADNLLVKEGRLSIFTSVGEVSEGYPESWIWNNGKKETLSCDYKKTGKTISFELPDLSTHFDTLVIDPELIFSTYSGSAVDNWGFTATYDNQGNVFSGGIASGAGYPVTTGAWQQTYGGGWDIAIIKYDSTGTQRKWASYLGGNQADIPHSIICDESGNLFIFGTTGSANFPVTPGAYDESFNGGTAIFYDYDLPYPQGVDIVVTKLSSDGTQLLASTFIGGSGNDGLNYRSRYAPLVMSGNDTLYNNYGDGARGEIAIDNQNYIYIGSCTFSTDYPTTPGVFQTQSRGKQEGVITKISPSLNSIIWSSYIGGSGDDAIYSIDITSTGQVLAAGGTTSQNLLTTNGAYKPSFQGGPCDGFLVKIAMTGQSLTSCSYFGSNQYDQIYFIRTDRNDNAYIYGQTEATGNTLIYNASYANPNSGQFLAKFNPSITSLQWSSVFGSGRTGPDISPTAFSIDVCNRIYVSGWGRIFGGTTAYPWGSNFGSKGMPITADALQNQTDGQDFYIGVFSEIMSTLEYGTFFGELHYSGCSYSGHDHVDGGTSRFDRNGNIYQSVCASCGSCQHFPTFPNPGAWSNTNNSSNCNNAVFKIKLITDFALASFSPVAAGCAPYQVQFQNTGRGTSWLWNFDDPASGAANTSTLKNPQHTFTQAGTFDVRLIAQWPASCNQADTLIRSVTVLSNIVYQLDTLTSCNEEPVQIGIAPSYNPEITYSWTPTAGLSDPTISNPIAKPVASTLYTLVAGNGICTDTIYQMIMVDQVWLNAPADTIVCDTSVVLSASFSIGAALLWSSSPLFNDTLNSYPTGSSIVVAYQGSNTFFLKAETTNGCTVIDSTEVTLSKPQAAIAGPSIICRGDSVWFTVTNPDDGYFYQWKSSAVILSGQGTDSLQIRPYTSGYAAVKVIDTLSGCSDTAVFFFDVDWFDIRLQAVPTTCFDTCDGTAMLTVTGGTPPYLIRWVNGQTGFSATNLCAGQQWAKITDSKGCDSLFLFLMPSPPEILTNDTSASVSCPGMTDGFITLNTAGGVSPYEWLWSNGATTESLTNLSPGMYSVTITDASGCKHKKTWVITEPEPISALSANQNIACHGDSTGTISVAIEGGTPPFTIIWNNGMTGAAIGNLPAGTYLAIITDSRGCELIFETTLTQPDSRIVVTPTLTPPTCFNSADGSIELAISGGVAPYTVTWDNGTTGLTNTNLPAGNHGVVVSDEAGCVTPFSFLLPMPDSMVMVAAITAPTCPSGTDDGSVQLTISGGTPPIKVVWNNGTQGTLLQGLTAGNYTATVTDSNQCVQQLTAHLLAPLPILIKATATNPSCYEANDGVIGTNASGGTPPYKYIWSTGADEPTIDQLRNGIYQISVIDSHNCQTDSIIELIEPQKLTVTKTTIPPECRGANNGSIRLTPAGGTQPYLILWDNGTEGNFREGLLAGSYFFTITDGHDCKLTDSATLQNRDCELVIPNVITPNNDGFNDFFEIPNIEYYPDNELFIYNRWGTEVRHYNSYQGQWNGRDQSGTPVADGTYFYILVLRNVKQYQGVITVLR